MYQKNERKRKNRKKKVCAGCGKEFMVFPEEVRLDGLCVVCCKKKNKINFSSWEEYRAAQLSQIAKGPRCTECGGFDIVQLQGEAVTKYKCNTCGFVYNPYMCGTGVITLARCEEMLDNSF